MSYIANVLDVFVSSPGDVAHYRDLIVAYINKWNQRNASYRKIFFNCLRWEDMVAPNIGRTAQHVINQQIGDEYDIYLGVMWTRFGTPTESASSGTEEEFERAVLRHINGDSVRVSLMFCQDSPSLSTFDPDQYKKVIEFKRKAQSMGCLTRDFIDESSLGNAINLILDDTANRFKSNTIGQFHESRDEDLNGLDSSGLVTERLSDERGLFDTLEDFEVHSNQLSSLTTEWAEKFVNIQDGLHDASDKLDVLSKYGRPSIQQVRPIVNEVTGHLKIFVDWSEDKILEYENAIELLSSDSIAIVDLSQSLDQSKDDLIQARDSINELCEVISSTNDGIEKFVNSIESGVKIDKAMNKVNNIIVSVHRRLIEKNKIFREDLRSCVDKIERMIRD